MTTPDIAGLCERLRRPGLKSAAEAAAALERQAAENKRLREALDFAVSCLCSLRKNYADGLGIWDDVDKAITARAALTGETHDHP